MTMTRPFIWMLLVVSCAVVLTALPDEEVHDDRRAAIGVVQKNRNPEPTVKKGILFAKRDEPKKNANSKNSLPQNSKAQVTGPLKENHLKPKQSSNKSPVKKTGKSGLSKATGSNGAFNFPFLGNIESPIGLGILSQGNNITCTPDFSAPSLNLSNPFSPISIPLLLANRGCAKFDPYLYCAFQLNPYPGFFCST